MAENRDSLTPVSLGEVVTLTEQALGASKPVLWPGAGIAASALGLARLLDQPALKSRLFVVVPATEKESREWLAAIRFFLSGRTGPSGELGAVAEFPGFDSSPWLDVSPDRRVLHTQMATLFRLSQGELPRVLVVSAEALVRKTLPAEVFASFVDILQKGETASRDGLLSLLAGGGYSSVPVVEDPATFAARGGIVDVFVPVYPFPIRIEWEADTIETIRFFDPETQRTLRPLDEVFIHPVSQASLFAQPEPRKFQFERLKKRLLEAGDEAEVPSSKMRALIEQVERGDNFISRENLLPAYFSPLGSLLDYLPASTIWLVPDADAIEQTWQQVWSEGEQAHADRLKAHELSFPPSEVLVEQVQLQSRLVASARIETPPFVEGTNTDKTVLYPAVEPLQALRLALRQAKQERRDGALEPLVEALQRWKSEGYKVYACAGHFQGVERLDTLLRTYGISTLVRRPDEHGMIGETSGADVDLELLVGELSEGIILPEDREVYLTELDILGTRYVRRAPARGKGKNRSKELGLLEPGSYIVHMLHGIGRYKGLAKLPLRPPQTGGGMTKAEVQLVEFLHLEYNGGTVYLPVWRLSEIQPYAGVPGAAPVVDKLGGQTWLKTKSEAAKKVKQLAEELLRLYAQRKTVVGHAAVLGGTTLQLYDQFEAAFPYEETPDQAKAIEDVHADLSAPRPMDRLVCGDVGYGKTEVALRAAAHIALTGKQVAVLAPTTVLVEQHWMTFRDRFADLPVRVAALSRFQNKKEQIETVKAVREGKVDIVIGTHRLLSTDVQFANLGLVVIDEEQRFGVTHKERLKQLRTHVDVLTLTATPIPRTLHMALSGLRDLSIITTPPAERRAVRTLVCRTTDETVVEGVRRELARGGQIFFVHNRVEDMGRIERWLRTLLPDVTMQVAHGQMTPDKLERAMIDFVDGKTQLLLCTTIIENGLDIPKANTLFVDRADQYGLAQLYQLRGRVGRSSERAYCYLLLPTEEAALTHDAKSRLAVLQRFSDLGSGFQIASYDLELRGAGELLGDKQSGALAEVGFYQYMQMLEEAVAHLKGEEWRSEEDAEVSSDIPAFIPDDYVSDVGQRMEFYARFSGAFDIQEIQELKADLSDRFGSLPDEVEALADVAELKVMSRRLHARAVEVHESRFGLALTDRTPIAPEKMTKLVSQKAARWRLLPDMRLARTYSDQERMTPLASAKRALGEVLQLIDQTRESENPTPTRRNHDSQEIGAT